jgi:hypothetical protein
VETLSQRVSICRHILEKGAHHEWQCISKGRPTPFYLTCIAQDMAPELISSNATTARFPQTLRWLFCLSQSGAKKIKELYFFPKLSRIKEMSRVDPVPAYNQGAIRSSTVGCRNVGIGGSSSHPFIGGDCRPSSSVRI